MFSRELGLDALADLRELDHRHPDRVAGDVAEVVAAVGEARRDGAVHVVAASRPARIAVLRRLVVLDVRLDHRASCRRRASRPARAIARETSTQCIPGPATSSDGQHEVAEDLLRAARS